MSLIQRIRERFQPKVACIPIKLAFLNHEQARRAASWFSHAGYAWQLDGDHFVTVTAPASVVKDAMDHVRDPFGVIPTPPGSLQDGHIAKLLTEL